jgi:Campylobacter major outer membrane protein
MKKIAKISLVAAIAVAGLTTANAQPLEEAIKNVDVTGSVVYRYNDYNDNDLGSQTNSSTTSNNYKVGLNLSSKVNDDVKFNSRLLASNVGAADGNWAPLDTSASGDANVSVLLSHANFAYTGVKNTTVTVGKQGLTTPYTVATQIDDNEQNGTGILALSALGPVTLGGAYFNQTNLNSSGDLASALNSLRTEQRATGSVGNSDIGALAAIVAAGPVTVDAWFLNLQDTFSTYTLGGKSEFKVGATTLGLDARYAALQLDDRYFGNTTLGSDNEDLHKIIKLAVTAKAGIVSGKVAYAATGNDGGITALDSDATTALKGWSLHTLNKTDAEYLQLVAAVDILSNLNLSANYGNLQSGAEDASGVEEEELYAQLTYKMSKNLSTYVRFGTYTSEATAKNTGLVTENNDDTRGRLQVAYTF